MVSPKAVRSLRSTQVTGNDPVTISWTASEGADRYQVEREKVPTAESDRDLFNIDGQATSYRDSSTEYNTRYSYRVRAGNDAGYGPWSRTARITTKPRPGLPEKPGNLSLEQDDDGSIVINWEAPQGEEVVTGYSVYRTKVSEGNESRIATTGKNRTSYTDGDVEVGTWYTYTVRATNDEGAGPASLMESIHVQALEPEAPKVPRSLKLSEETAGQVVISWKAPSEGPDPTGYRVYRETIGETSMALLATVGGSRTRYTDDTVAEETLYGYQVTAVNGDAEGPYVGPRSLTTKVQTPGVPEKPTRVQLSEDTPGQVVISWRAPSSGPEPAGYRVYRKRLSQGGDHGQGDVQIGTTGSDGNSFTDDTVDPEVTYVYNVSAYNEAGESSLSGLESITTKPQNEGTPEEPEDVETDQ